jgi:hypothetical protein
LFFGGQNNHHTSQSWRNYYKNHREQINELVERLKKEKQTRKYEAKAKQARGESKNDESPNRNEERVNRKTNVKKRAREEEEEEEDGGRELQSRKKRKLQNDDDESEKQKDASTSKEIIKTKSSGRFRSLSPSLSPLRPLQKDISGSDGSSSRSTPSIRQSGKSRQSFTTEDAKYMIKFLRRKRRKFQELEKKVYWMGNEIWKELEAKVRKCVFMNFLS